MTTSIERIERSGYVAWSAEETETIGGWTVSANGGFTRRLNSATARGAADASLSTRDAIREWLGDRGVPLTVRVTPLIDAGTLDECEATWGLTSVDETVVMATAAGRGRDTTGIELIDPAEDAFVDDLLALNGRTGAVRPQWDAVVGRIMPHATGLWIPGSAVGFVALSDGIAAVFSVAVRSDVRRCGIATRIMAAAESWATINDSETIFLQVLGTNVPARGLYQKLGYDEAYRYRYLQPSPDEQERNSIHGREAT